MPTSVSIWGIEKLQELGHEVIVANVREFRTISHSDRKSDQVDAEKIARYARLDPKILRSIAHLRVGIPPPPCSGKVFIRRHLSLDVQRKLLILMGHWRKVFIQLGLWGAPNV
jgi:hypothetical protein